MASSPNKLTDLQRRVIEEFFRREQGFYLTGGAALAGYYLGHRSTTDLDFFTPSDDAFERGRFILEDVARSMGASIEVRQRAPGFERYVITREEDALVIDLVRETVPQLHDEKIERDGIRLDPPDEILVNKITAMVSRGEIRDLVDVFLLERAGHPVEAAMPEALRKDGGCTAGTLAWVLSEMQIPDGAALPGDVAVIELREYLENLVRRLRRLAVPDE